MFNLINRDLVQIEGDVNNDELYNLFNQMTGLNLEFEIEQEYGTACYGIDSYISEEHFKKFDPSLEEIERKIEANKNSNGKEVNWKDHIHHSDIIAYFRHKDILPKKDFLFNVDY